MAQLFPLPPHPWERKKRGIKPNNSNFNFKSTSNFNFNCKFNFNFNFNSNQKRSKSLFATSSFAGGLGDRRRGTARADSIFSQGNHVSRTST